MTNFIHWTNDPRVEAASDPLDVAKAIVECGMMRPSALTLMADAIGEFGVSVMLDAWWSAHDPTGVERNVNDPSRAFLRGHSKYEHPDVRVAIDSIP